MKSSTWNVAEQLSAFDLGRSGAVAGVWKDKDALFFDQNELAAPVLLHEIVDLPSYRIQAEIACPGPYGFVGLAFGARDAQNYELVYISPASADSPGDIQYDPIMNGSSTWQIYHGPRFQAEAPFPAGEWTRLALDVHPNQVSIFVGDSASPQLVITSLQHGYQSGRIGVWGYLPSYIRNLQLVEIPPIEMDADESVIVSNLKDDVTSITNWTVSQPYLESEQPQDEQDWINVQVEENGTLNLNRLFPSGRGLCVQAKTEFVVDEEIESLLSFGFSDRVCLRVNEIEVYKGVWKWDPPSSDGRIRANFASLPVRWKKGLNSIRAEIISDEVMFGWGLNVVTVL